MTALDYILDGLEAALELERELGVRTVEIDRGVLVPRAQCLVPRAKEKCLVPRAVVPRANKEEGLSSAALSTKHQALSTELVFLHDRPLAPAGVEMMAKILNALGKPDAPIVVAPPVPEAKVTVVLGGLALKKYFPGMKGEPGQWQKTPEGRDVLITYSPAYILRFGTVTPAVEKIKQDMWRSLKAVKQRLVPSA